MRLLGLTLLVAYSLASAQPGKDPGTVLFEEGRALAAKGRWAEACAKFDESFKRVAAPGTALNYGDCLEQLRQLRRAWRMYDFAAREFEKLTDSRAAFARQRANAVVPKLAAITVKVENPAIPGLVIQIGDIAVDVAAVIEDRFEPGDIVVTASAPGYTDFTTTANGLAGSSVIVEIPAALGAGRGGAVGPFIDPDDASEVRPRDRMRVRIALITGGVGAAAFATSLILGSSAKSLYDDALDSGCEEVGGAVRCPTPALKEQVDDAGTRANIATGFAIGGGVLIGAAVVLYVTAPRESLQVAPTATASSVGVTFSGRF